MQDSNSKPLDLSKRETCNGQYDVPPALDSGTWNQLLEQAKAKQQLKEITKTEKSEKPQALLSNTEPAYPQEGTNTMIPKESNGKQKN